MEMWKQKIAISKLLKLQLLYCFMGVGYNVVSYLTVMFGGQQLSATSPITGVFFMAFYGLCLIPGYTGYLKTYRLLMFFFLVASGYGGIVKHFIIYTQDPTIYASFLAWISAIGINVFGFLLNLLAVAGKFESGETQATS